MTQFPYGIADFRRIRREGMVYVDRTAYVRDLEMLGSVLVFLRPRRFGKSLWLQTLANYYDLRRADEFETLFGNLAIGSEPTPLHNRYFVLQWNFSEIDPGGSVPEIAASLHDHVRSRARIFAADYEKQLARPVEIEGSPPLVLDSLLGAIRQTPYRLYLLIDEYDNFVNEVMARDTELYRALFDVDGPYKQLFKSVKAATEGRGLERVFVTGVSPVALNDLTSGFNNARDVSVDPDLASLCGFREQEILDLLQTVARERDLATESVEETLATMRTWYNGYRFTHGPPGRKSGDAVDLVYNPTNALYFLEHLHRWRTPPERLQDENLRTDRGKLAFLATTSAGSGVIEELTEGDGEIAVPRLATSFSLDDLMARMQKDRGAVASMLYYMGHLTLTGDVPPRLRIPNLVVRKLFLERLLEIYLPDLADSSGVRDVALAFFQDGDLGTLLAFFEDKLLPVLSNRDRGAPPPRPGLSGSGMNEMALKALFLAILFDDSRYLISSETELARRYADLFLLVRPEMRHYGFFDILLELKLVRRKALGKKGQELRDMDDVALRRLTPVAQAFKEARGQVESYRRALVARHGASLELRCFAVVAVGLERILGEEVEAGAT